MKIVLLIPVFEDWESAALLCDRISGTFDREPPIYDVYILFVDDGSYSAEEPLRRNQKWNAIRGIHILRLRRNIGHQRAIAIGFAYIEHHVPCDAVVVMDADGEDVPEAIPSLLAAASSTPSPQLVFAERGQRRESIVFRVLYLGYLTAHKLFTGRGIRFGNFSVVPFSIIKRLTAMPELWSHYAAAVVTARIPYSKVRVDRGKRLTGTTKMNLEALILHGLSAVAIYPTVGVRTLMGSVLTSGFLLLVAFGIVIARFATTLTIPGWASIMGICLILICVILVGSLLYVFTSLAFRQLLGMLPTRDYVYFVDRCDCIYPADGITHEPAGAGFRT